MSWGVGIMIWMLRNATQIQEELRLLAKRFRNYKNSIQTAARAFAVMVEYMYYSFLKIKFLYALGGNI